MFQGLKNNSFGLSFCVSGTESDDVPSPVPSSALTTASRIHSEFSSSALVLRSVRG
ncbi:hypothetical protein HAX54_037143, partial [Datura stramonium]|nr:hypothetical protein [Datura stramonium]